MVHTRSFKFSLHIFACFLYTDLNLVRIPKSGYYTNLNFGRSYECHLVLLFLNLEGHQGTFFKVKIFGVALPEILFWFLSFTGGTRIYSFKSCPSDSDSNDHPDLLDLKSYGSKHPHCNPLTEDRPASAKDMPIYPPILVLPFKAYKINLFQITIFENISVQCFKSFFFHPFTKLINDIYLINFVKRDRLIDLHPPYGQRRVLILLNEEKVNWK